MARKLRYGLTAKAIKGTPPKWLSIATAIAGLLLVAQDQIVGDVPALSDNARAAVTAWYEYIIEIAQVILSILTIFIGYEDAEGKADTDNIYSGYSNNGIIKVILLLITVSIIASSCSKKTLDITRTREYIDSSWTTPQQVQVPVQGGATPNTNMDSLKRLLEQYRRLAAMGNNSGNHTPGYPQEIINKIYTIPDTSGRYELQYWMTATGELMARCMAKDTTINLLIEQNNRLIKDTSTVTTTKTVKRVPAWAWYLLGINVLIVAVWLIKKYYKGWLPKS